MKKTILRLCVLSALFLFLVACDSGSAPKVKTSPPSANATKVKAMGTILASSAEVWNTISTFAEPEQYMKPMIQQSTASGNGIGMVRKLETADGAKITEQLTALDGSAMSLSYAATESSLPMNNYQSTIRVKDLGNGNCQVFWEGSFEPQTKNNLRQLQSTLKETYARSIFGLKRLHMESITIKELLEQPAEKVWAVIGTFEKVERYQQLFNFSKTVGRGKGARRFCATPENKEFSEELVDVNRQQFYLRYEGLDSEWPMAGFESEMQLRPISDSQCELRWTAVYKPLGDTAAELRGLVGGMLQQGAEGLKQLEY
ncbi:MAG: SRPBCC family protein [Bacteroidota bacterium]